MCGDWVVGTGIPAALASGVALGRQVAAQRGVGPEGAARYSVGLGASFRHVAGSSKEGLGVCDN